MKRVGELLQGSTDRAEVLRGARAQRALRNWAEVVGKELAARCAPDRFQAGTVWVAATGSAWAQEVRMRKELIVERLNDIAGEKLFVDLRVGVRQPRRSLLPEEG